MNEKDKKKRLGRPPKVPASGQRVPLGLRVSPKLKQELGAAAQASGRSLSQEAELRLENSLKSDSCLMLVQGKRATPVLFHGEAMLIPVGYEAVALRIGFYDRERLLDYFREQWVSPWEIFTGGFEERRPSPQGERVPLGLRVTADLKSALDTAATQSGWPQSQEAEWRLDNSLESDKRLMLVQGTMASPVVFRDDRMWIPLGPTYEDVAASIRDTVRDECVGVRISRDDCTRIRCYFDKQWPVPGQEFLAEEIEVAGDRWMTLQAEIKRGK